MDLAFEDAHQKSPRLIKAHELGLNEYQYRPRRALGERLAYDRRMIDLVDHLLPTQDAAIQGLSEGNMRALYTAVSTTSRHLLEVAAEHLSQFIAAARVTHEVAYIVEMVWELEKQPEVTFGVSQEDRISAKPTSEQASD